MKTNHGGARKGAGRPKGSGKFAGKETKLVRVPAEVADNVVELLSFTPEGANYALGNVQEIRELEDCETLELPLLEVRVSCGLPSPADDYVESRLDLMKFLVKNPASTFYALLTGDSMEEAGIYHNDIALVDKSRTVKSGDIVLVTVNNDLTCKRIYKRKDSIWLMPENKNYRPMKLNSNHKVDIWGVVVHTIRTHQNNNKLTPRFE